MGNKKVFQKLRDKIPLVFFVIVLLMICIGIFSYNYYFSEKKNILQNKKNELSAIAELKKKQIQEWLRERKSDAFFLFNNKQLIKKIISLSGKPTQSIKADLADWLQPMLENTECEDILIVDAQKKIVLSVSGTYDSLELTEKENLDSAFLKATSVFSDLYKDIKGKTSIDLCTPLYEKTETDSIYTCSIIQKLNPYTGLFPLLQTWPTTSTSSEAFLVEKNLKGDSVVFLNELKHRTNAALNLKISINDTIVPAVKAVKGVTGVFEGVDYRGIPVIAATTKISGTNWYLITKTDKEEMYESLNKNTTWFLLFMFTIFLFMLSIAWIFSFRRKVNIYKRLYIAEQKKEEAEKKFKLFFENSPVGKSITEIDGTVHVNKAFCDMLGYTEMELKNKNIRDLTHPDDVALSVRMMKDVAEERCETVGFEKRFIHKKGYIVWADVKSTLQKDNNGAPLFFITSLFDITEKKQAEEKEKISSREKDILLNAAIKFSEISQEKNIGALITDTIGKLTDAKYIIVSSYQKESNEFNIEFVFADTETKNNVFKILGTDVAGIKIPATKIILDALLKKELVSLSGSLYELTGGVIKKKYCEEIEKIIRFEKVMVAGFAAENELLGCATLLLQQGEKIENTDTLKTFLYQASAAIKKRTTELKLQNIKERYKQLFENMGNAVVVYQAVDGGEDFIIMGFNKKAEQIEGIEREKLIGKKVSEIFPGIREMGILEVFRRVWKTGYSEHFPATIYRDNRISGWRENFIYRLPSGEIIAVYDDVTPQKKAEISLIESEKRYRELFNNASDLIYTIDLEGNFTSFNETAERVIGFVPDPSGKVPNMKDFLDPDEYRKALENLMYKVKSGDPHTRYDAVLNCSDGRKIILEINSYLRYKDGKPFEVFGIGRDMTEFKKAVNAVKESEEKYRLLAENVSDVIWTMEIETLKFTYISPSVAKLRGYTVEEAMSIDFRETIPGKYYDYIIQAIPDRIQKFYENRLTESDKVFELEQYCKDGRLIWVEIVANFITDKDGKIKEILGVSRDITEHKHAEQEIEKYHKQFESFFRKHNAVFLLMNGNSGQIIDANDAAIKFYGYSLSQLKTMKIGDINMLLPEELDMEWQRALREERKYFIVPHRLANGKIRTVEVHTTPVTFTDDTYLFSVIFDITERKNAEEALMLSQARYKIIFENSGTANAIFDRDCCLVLQNEFSANLLGVKPGEAYGKSVLDIFGSKKGPLIKERMLRIFSTQIAEDFETFFTLPSGEKYFHTLYHPIFDEQNQSLYIQLISQDITERKLAEEALRMSEEKFRNLVETTNDIIWETDSMSLYTYVSPHAEAILGYSPDELIGHSPFDFMPADEAVKIKKQSNEIISSKKPFNDFININLHKDGHPVVFETSGVPVLDANNNFLGYRGIDRDITKRIEAEKELKKLSMAVEQSPVTIVITDIEGHIEYVNSKFSELTGYTFTEAIGQNPRILKTMHTPKEEYKVLWDTILSGNSWRGEFKNRKKNGDTYWETALISPITNKEGTITNFLAIKEDITEIKLAEQALKESRTQLDLTLRSANMGIWSWDIITNIRYFDEQVCKLLGIDRSQFRGTEEEFFNTLHPDDRGKIKNKLKEVIETGNEYRPEFRVVWPDGSLHYISSRGILIKDQENRPLRINGILWDVTERKLNEEILRRSEEKFRNIYANIQDVYYETTLEGEILEVSPSIINISKFRREELIGKNIQGFYSDAAEREKLIETISEKGHVTDFEISLIDKNDKIQRCSVTSRFLFDNDNKPYRIVGSMRNIEERKRAEAELHKLLNTLEERVKQRTSELARSEELYYTTVNSFNSWVFVIDDQRKIIFINKRFLDFFDENDIHEDYTGKNIHDVFTFLGEENLSLYDRVFEEFKEMENEGEYNVLGKTYYSHVKLSPVIRNKKIMRVVTTVHDHTKIKMVENEIKKNLEKEKELNALKSQFISTVSHEFRTPLAGIQSSVQLLKRYNDKWGKEKKEKIFKQIFDAVQHTKTLLDDVSLIDKEESRKIRLRPSLLNLKELLLEIVEENKQVYGPDFEIATKFKLVKSKYFFDKDMIRYIVGNVLSNAIKYSGVSRKIQFNVMEKRNEIYFNIIDFGIGIPAEDQKFLFEPFHRASNVLTIQGTGFGLTIVKRFVNMHNGTIKIESEMNKGTSVTIKLPCTKDREE